MKKTWKLKDLIAALEKAYCGKMAVEYAHITNQEEVAWLRDRVEKTIYDQYTAEEKITHYSRLQWAH